MAWQDQQLLNGTAGEHLVCADLIIRGHLAYRTDQLAWYDVVADVDQRPIRIQVKTTKAPRFRDSRAQTPAYYWQIRKDDAARGPYCDGDFDICALVALDTREIAYVALVDCGQAFQIRPTHIPDFQPVGNCRRCGVSFAERTKGCLTCNARHSGRRRKTARSKRFAQYTFDKAMERVVLS